MFIRYRILYIWVQLLSIAQLTGKDSPATFPTSPRPMLHTAEGAPTTASHERHDSAPSLGTTPPSADGNMSIGTADTTYEEDEPTAANYVRVPLEAFGGPGMWDTWYREYSD